MGLSAVPVALHGDRAGQERDFAALAHGLGLLVQLGLGDHVSSVVIRAVRTARGTPGGRDVLFEVRRTSRPVSSMPLVAYCQDWP